MTFFRPDMEGSGFAEYVEPRTGRHYRVTAASLDAFVERNPIPRRSSSQAEILPESVMDTLRGYYWEVSSRITFVDQRDETGEIRASLLKKYDGIEATDDEFREEFAQRLFGIDGIHGASYSYDALGKCVGGVDIGILLERLAIVRMSADERKDELAPLDSFLGSIRCLIALETPVAGLFQMLICDPRTRRATSLRVQVQIEDACGAHLLLMADFQKYQVRYRHDRALRHLWMDAGYVCEEIVQQMSRQGRSAQRLASYPWRRALSDFSTEAELATLEVLKIAEGCDFRNAEDEASDSDFRRRG